MLHQSYCKRIPIIIGDLPFPGVEPLCVYRQFWEERQSLSFFERSLSVVFRTIIWTISKYGESAEVHLSRARLRCGVNNRTFFLQSYGELLLFRTHRVWRERSRKCCAPSDRKHAN